MPELREPNLPASARRVATSLRKGWTTGICSAAAAKGATIGLHGGSVPTEVEVPLPKPGARARFAVAEGWSEGGRAQAIVVKDAGDDPDVTDGSRLTATVTRRGEPGIELRGGTGVGTVTRPGLGLEIGAPAINAGPRKQIAAAVGEVVDLATHGVTIEISVPGGEKMARRTTNPRLGIVGGISILGTTGIVRPFSTAAWRASVGQAIDVAAAQGFDTVVLTTGGRTDAAAQRLLPLLPPVCFIEVGDFTGYALRRASGHGLARLVFVGMAGKLAKLAAGILMTHWTRSKVDPGLLGEMVAEAGADSALVDAVMGANTARHAFELWTAAGLTRAGDLLCERVAANLRDACENKLAAEVILVDFEATAVCGASGAARAWLGEPL
jgi:cobalt-precorrin-5B (C1)-methyltransferase